MLVLKNKSHANSRGVPLRIALDKATTSLGRNTETSDIFIDSPRRPHMISRLHAKIKRDEASGSYTLVTFGVNGVLVNGVKRDRAALCDGDEVVFGGSGAETKVGQRVRKPDSDLVYCFSVSSEDEMSRSLETSLNQTCNSGILRMDDCDSELQDSHQMSPSVFHREDEKIHSHISLDSTDTSGHEQLPVKCEGADAANEKACSSKSKLLEDLNEELICCICRELICVAHALPCSHAFCKDCIRDWLKRSKECPTCRAKATFNKTIAVKMLDNAIGHVAVSVLSEEEMKERNEKIQRLLHEDGPEPKKRKASPKRMTTRHSAAVETFVISSDSESDDDSDDADESVIAIDESEDDFVEMANFGVEHAVSGRARCRVCWTAIPLRALRWCRSFVEPVTYYHQNHYFHFDCYRPPRHVTFDQIAMHGLNRAEQERVREKLETR